MTITTITNGTPASAPLGKNGNFKPEWIAFFGTLLSNGFVIYPPTEGGVQQTDMGIVGGKGVPSNSKGSNGWYYLRSDGSTSTTHIYHKESGTWTGIA